MSSKTDFLMNYGEQIQNCVRTLRAIKGKEITEETYNRIEGRMQAYDTNVGDAIDSWTYRGVDADKIANFAIENMNRWGTEPQMVLYAIEDFSNEL
jgi:hypothetical protein